jgi:hypothetical protein
MISPAILRTVRNAQTLVVEKIKKHISFLITFFKNSAIHEIMWENMVEPDSPQMTIWCMSLACQLTEAADTC